MFPLSFLVSFIVLFLLVNCQLKEPSSSDTDFERLPSRIYYFEDSKNVLWHDGVKGVLHISENEGKTFAPVSGIPEGAAAMFIEHPFDKSQAYVLTNGMIHYRTKDNGHSWQSFGVEVPPSNPTPLSFHSDEEHSDYILYHGRKCDPQAFYANCADVMYYTTDGFSTPAILLLNNAVNCIFAHSSKEFGMESPQNLILCLQSKEGHGSYNPTNSHLITSTDFFVSDKTVVDLGENEHNPENVFALVIMSEFAVAAVQKNDPENTMEMFVSQDGKMWRRADFSHTNGGGLSNNPYTLLSGSAPGLNVDILTNQRALVGSLFISDSNGTFFTEILSNTNRNRDGFVEYQPAPGIERTAIVNVVTNVDVVENRGWGKRVASIMTFDDGKTWGFIPPPLMDVDGLSACPNVNECALHLHSVTMPLTYGRILFSPASGHLMGIGNVGTELGSLSNAHTFLSEDAGRTWKTVLDGPSVYESSGKGSLIVLAQSDKPVRGVRYSIDAGQTWKEYNWSSKVPLNTIGIFTHPNSASLKFMLVGTGIGHTKQHVAVFLDFSEIGI